MSNDGLNDLMDSLKFAEFCKAFANDPSAALKARNIDVPYHFLNVMAELSYDELRLLGNIGAELRVAAGDSDGPLLF